jgi:hypothetical protein
MEFATMDDVHLLLQSNGFTPVATEQAMEHVIESLVQYGELDVQAQVPELHMMELEYSEALSEASSDCEQLLIQGLPAQAVVELGHSTEQGWLIDLMEWREHDGRVLVQSQDPVEQDGLNFSTVNGASDDVCLTNTVIEDHQAIEFDNEIAKTLQYDQQDENLMVSDNWDDNDDFTDVNV